MTDIQDREAAAAALARLELDLDLDLDLALDLDIVTELGLDPELVLDTELVLITGQGLDAPLGPVAEDVPLASTPPVLPARGAARRAARTTRTVRRRTVVMWVATVILTALVAATLLFQAAGGRWFIVQTPSMGTTAPVGTLVLTTPALVDDVHVGDVVSFHPATTPGETYTHRVISVEGGTIRTQGDINGAVDPWETKQAELIGTATTILPGFGWLARGLPLLLAGSVIVMALTRLLSSPTNRASMRMLGVSLVAALTVFLIKPFVGLVVLEAVVKDGSAKATLVSTGLLPIRVSAAGGTHVDLAAGQVGTITAPAGAAGEFHSISSTLALPLWGWIVFVIVCAVPLLFTLIVGLPAEEEAPVLLVATDPEQAEAAPDAAAGIAATASAPHTETAGDPGERDRMHLSDAVSADR